MRGASHLASAVLVGLLADRVDAVKHQGGYARRKLGYARSRSGRCWRSLNSSSDQPAAVGSWIAAIRSHPIAPSYKLHSIYLFQERPCKITH
jgi:hypothetical protein